MTYIETSRIIPVNNSNNNNHNKIIFVYSDDDGDLHYWSLILVKNFLG